MSAPNTPKPHWQVHGHVLLLPNRLHERAAHLAVHTQQARPVADGAAHVVLESCQGPFVLAARLDAECARLLAGLLLEGADVVDLVNSKGRLA